MTDFPSVTICNLFPYDRKNPENFEYLNNILRNFGFESDLRNNRSSDYALDSLKTAVYFTKAYEQADTSQSKPSKLIFQLDSMLISCHFNGMSCKNTDFRPFISFEYGSCFQFIPKPSKIGRIGPTSGLTLELFIGYPQIHDYLSEIRGLYLAVHNMSKEVMTKYEGMKIPVGKATDIGITRTFYYGYPYPYSKCYDNPRKTYPNFNDTFYKQAEKDFYSQKLCFEFCLQGLFISPNCGCLDPSIKSRNNIKELCSDIRQIECVLAVRREFDSKDLAKPCEEYCPLECDKIKYETHTSMSDYPTNYYYEIISKNPKLKDKYDNVGKNVSFDTFKSSVVMLNVFYEDLGYTAITQKPAYTFDTLIGVIG